ncbi:hypothetical protein SCLCIDRAFT_1217340 [Scleroderma citrinum Foug A]|uniref:Beach-domain-containing protein n=1 Tax=Scleroderma citrinum Foug A TaxID=1036808 RepID=A0A0C2ZDN2_9AGAM|nr:hypothetical protein SCLCIDRAFT_1217340 [Scleroderma citrinum Foug A]
MLRSLLTPLRNLQDFTHEAVHQAEDAGEAQDLSSPQSDQMKASMEELKVAASTVDRIAILQRILVMLNEHPRVLDAFRESDGFLVLIHVLSTLPTATSVALTSSWSLQDVLQCMQLAFMVASKALDGHQQNQDFFQEFVGYSLLSDACKTLLLHQVTSEKTLGCILSLSFHDFGLADLFISLGSYQDFAELEMGFLEYAPSFGTIRLPHVFKIAWDFMACSLTTSGPIRMLIYKILEHLTQSSHHNLAVLTMTGILAPLFSQFTSSPVNDTSTDSPSPERRLLNKILKRLFEMGASAQDVRQLLQYAVNEDGSLDAEMIEFLRIGMKSSWPSHVSLSGSSVVTKPLQTLRALPSAGFAFTMWAWFERLPLDTCRLLSISFGAHHSVKLSLGSNGTLALRTSARQDATVLSKSKISTSRWTHIAVVHYTARSSHPTVRIFIDGVLTQSFDWTYPKSPDTPANGQFTLGDATSGRTLSWCIASSYLISTPLDDNVIKFMHGLGPRYHANFQDKNLVRFLTYEVSTSLNMHLLSSASGGDNSSLRKVIHDGPLFNENFILVKVAPEDVATLPPLGPLSASTSQEGSGTTTCITRGDACVAICQPFDLVLWRLGGARLVLRLVQLAQTQHELSRVITILCDSIRNCWQNSEDMERISGYDALASVLYTKGQLINVTSFETLFEFLGLNFRSPDASTVTNTIAYRAIALDFELWSTTSPAIQRAHLEHFSFLLRSSRHRRFNARVRLSKLEIVRKLLFALQSTWYPDETIPHVINAIVISMQGHFPAADVIKPVISYISAYIVVTEPSVPPSPRSSGVLNSNNCERARQLLGAVISLLRIPATYARIAESIPLPRVVLLWVGPQPSPTVACQVLSVIGIALSMSSSFGKKLELLSGWSLLRKRLPAIWDEELHRAAVELLLRPTAGSTVGRTTSQSIRCSQILPVILMALRNGLLVCCDKRVLGPTRVTEQIVADMIELHNTNPSFCQLFKSQSTTEVLIECLSNLPPGHENAKICTQVTHFGLLVANGNHVSHHQKQQILGLLKPESNAIRPPTATTMLSTLATVRAESLRKAISRLDEWRNTIITSERERHRKTVVDLRERRQRLVTISTGITKAGSERDIWSHLISERIWQIDETEGSYRARIKLEPIVETSYESLQHAEREDEALSMVARSEGNIRDSTDDSDTPGLLEDIVEDKHRRVRHELEPGDVIEAVSTVARVSGVDSWPGLLIFGKSHLYMLDGLVENELGEVIDAIDAPKSMFFVAGSTPGLRRRQAARRWQLAHIVGFSNRSFLFRDVGLEVFFKDSRTLLTVFLGGAQRHNVSQRLQTIILRYSLHGHPSIFSLILRDMSIALPGGRNLDTSHEKALATAQQQWCNREISNYAYISILNQLSGRTPNDATQYPVFPWVLQDYTSDTLDLSSPDSFRDLTKPMGALTEGRREIAENRYLNLQSVDEKPFHYGTHFSSSMIVCHYLIRLMPFTGMFKTLQGGDWDLPDRLFSDIGRAYLSASQDVRGDVRELVPEFFSFPEFLENILRLDFGSQSSGEKINDVKLPPWAKEDPLLFVTLHRRALESHYVSENLPAWIALIWGCQQRSVESLNAFHPLSYEGAIDLDKVTDPVEREATIGIIHNFGQTPRKLFDSPHPPRNLQGLLSLPAQVTRGVCEDALVLTKDARPLKLALESPVVHIATDPSGKVYPMPHGEIFRPSRCDDQVQWGKASDPGALQVIFHHAVVQTIESVYTTCAVFADQDTLVTGSADSILRIWHLSHGTSPVAFSGTHNMRHRKGREPLLSLTHLLRGHNASVLCIQTSRTWSIVISGSSDGSAILWDLNRGTYVRSIWHDDGTVPRESSAVNFVAINESTGYIATCSTRYLWLHTINARPITKLDLLSTRVVSSAPQISSIAFHERDYSQLGILAVGNTNGSITFYSWNADGTPTGSKAQWEFVKVRDLLGDPGSSAAITALKFVGEILWVGDASGKVFRWRVPE